MKSFDPTRIDIKTDPTRQLMSGVTYHGNISFTCPLISHIGGNLWVGGCEDGIRLPNEIDHVISLYPWEEYKRHTDHFKSYAEFVMYDATGMDQTDTFLRVAAYVTECLRNGPTLIHCQAGLNRSNTVAAIALTMLGADPEDAIALLREKRSPAVLCNPDFERLVLGLVGVKGTLADNDYGYEDVFDEGITAP